MRATPRLSFTAICEYLNASPTRQLSILREQKHPSVGPLRGYAQALRQVKDFAVEGRPLAPKAPDLDDHEREVLTCLAENNWVLPAPSASHPSTRQPAMLVGGVEISALPDLYLEEDLTSRRRTGALKFFMPKRELDGDAGKWMASLLFTYMRDTLNDQNCDPSLCLVYDVRQDEYHAATKSHKRLFQNIESACVMINAIWPKL